MKLIKPYPPTTYAGFDWGISSMLGIRSTLHADVLSRNYKLTKSMFNYLWDFRLDLNSYSTSGVTWNIKKLLKQGRQHVRY